METLEDAWTSSVLTDLAAVFVFCVLLRCDEIVNYLCIQGAFILPEPSFACAFKPAPMIPKYRCLLIGPFPKVSRSENPSREPSSIGPSDAIRDGLLSITPDSDVT